MKQESRSSNRGSWLVENATQFAEIRLKQTRLIQSAMQESKNITEQETQPDLSEEIPSRSKRQRRCPTKPCDDVFLFTRTKPKKAILSAPLIKTESYSVNESNANAT